MLDKLGTPSQEDRVERLVQLVRIPLYSRFIMLDTYRAR